MIEIHGDGQQIRTFTYVDDTVDGFVRALRDARRPRRDASTSAASTPTTILELAHAVHERARASPQPLRARFVPYDELPGNYQDVRYRIPDTTKARELLGFAAQVAARGGPRATRSRGTASGATSGGAARHEMRV